MINLFIILFSFLILLPFTLHGKCTLISDNLGENIRNLRGRLDHRYKHIIEILSMRLDVQSKL